jgi:hypothetical protein
VRRLRRGELLSLLGAVLLLVMLFFGWYTVPPGTVEAGTGGWEAMGVLVSILLGLPIFLSFALAITTVVRRSPALPVAFGVLTFAVGLVVWIVLLIRLLNEPALGAALDGADVTLRWPGYVGFAAMTLIVVGGMESMRDERRDAPESAYTPPPPRPIPEPIPTAADGSADTGS